MTDPAALIAAFAAAASEPAKLPEPVPAKWDRRDAQRRFDTFGLPRGLAVAA